MKTGNARRRPTIVRLYPVLVGLMVLIAVVLMAPSHSADSSWLRSEKESASTNNLKPTEGDLATRLRLSKWISPLSLPLAGETVELFAADCATPRNDFHVGEVVCAKTNGVDLTVSGNHYMTWIDSQTNSVNGGTITQNPQFFTYVAPAADTFKASIGRLSPADSSIIGNPPQFTVTEGLAVATFAANCTTPKTAFVLGDTVCAKVSGLAVNTFFPNRIAWADPSGSVRSDTDLTTDPQTNTFTLPASASSAVGNVIVDNRGTWRANITRSNGRRITSASFSVSDPAQAVADVYVQKFNRDPGSPISTGGSVVFRVLVGNNGPDAAASVNLVDVTPVGMTLLAFTQQTGTACSPSGTGNCTIASLSSGDQAEFTAIYNTGTVAPGVYVNTASVSSPTADSKPENNSSSVEFELVAGAGGSQCSLICPTSPAPVNNAPGQNGATVDWNGANNDNNPVATGTGCGAVSVSATSPAFFSIGSTPVTVTTESGEECSFTVTVLDNENPNIGNCPANITVTEDSGTPGSAIVNFATPGATDNSGDVTVNCDQPSGSSFSVTGSPHLVTCTATDGSGNADSCTFNVTVNAANANCTLTPPANITVDSDENQCGANVTYTAPTESGTCGTVTCDRPSGSFFPGGTTVVTCSDGGGASTSFSVTVNDTTEPAPVVDPLPTLTGECSVTAGVPVTIDPPGPQPPYTVIELPKANDNCDGIISASTQNERTYTVAGTYVVNWTYTDSSGNTTTQQQTVVVTGTDNSAPVPDVATLPTVTGECTATVSGAPTATDNCAGTVTGTTSNPLTYTGAGTYTVQWIYDDGRGNTSTQNQTVVVTDEQAPVVTLTGGSTVTVECHTSYTDAGATANDNCLGSMTPTANSNVDVNTLGTYQVVWSATDDANNTGTATRTVNVVDTIAPIITLNGANPMTVILGSTFADPGATANDSCAGSFAATPSGTVNTNVVGSYTVTYNATDPSGNAATAVTRTVKVIYNFTGFFSPVENPDVFNQVKAGQSVPLKFSLSGNQGLSVLAADSPTSIQIACPGGAIINDVSEIYTLAAGNSGLGYDSLADQYKYVWKTESSWANTCRQFILRLNDGTVHTANFKFKQ